MHTRKIWNFRHSEILSRASLQSLHQSPVHCCSWGTKLEQHNWALHEGSPVLDSMDVPSSAPKYSMPLEGFLALESTGALLSAPTQFILEVLFTKPSKEV